MIEEIFCWRVDCSPWDIKSPIKCMTIFIEAKNRKEAELIALNAYKFFDQDMHFTWNEPIQGYRQVEDKK